MYNPMSLKDKRILVTGASSGIGRCCAEIMSRLGAQIVLVARDRGRLERAAQGLTGSGHRVEPFDLNDVEAIPGWLKKVTADGFSLDGLLHSAGINITCPMKGMAIADYERLMKINATSGYALAKGFRQRSVCRPPASLVFISSIASTTGNMGLSAYAASKAALLGMSKTLAIEFVRDGIRVNCISPGLVETEMVEGLHRSLTQDQLNAIIKAHPIGLGKPEDIAFAAAFLLAGTSRWITGINLIVDGGYTAQ